MSSCMCLKACAASIQEDRATSGVVLGPHWGMGRGSNEILTAKVSDGFNHVDWPDGSEFLGEWQGGHPHGRGTYVWPSGPIL
jgi:MORN repeat